MPHNQHHWCRYFWTRRRAATLPRTAAILSPSRLQWGIRCDPRAMFACFAHGEQQTNEPESQTPTQISPHCVALYSLFFFKSHSEIGVETKLLLVSSCLFLRERKGRRMRTSPSFPSWSAALGPRGNDIMRISMPTLCLISIVNAAHTLHFGPVMVALWAALRIWQSIMSAQWCRFSSRCCLLQSSFYADCFVFSF